MEEHIWFLVEKFISGAASGAEQRELQQLLAVYPEIYVSVKEFLSTYKDPEPQVTQAQVSHFLTEVDYLIADAAPVKHALQNQPATIPSNTVTAWPTPKFTQKLNDKLQSELAMARHFLKIAIRNLQRNRAISLVNIIGLAVGIASAVVILMWVQNQLSYDQFHKNKDRVVRLYNRAKVDGTMQAWRVTPIPLGPALKANYPQVEDIARINWIGAFVLKNGDKKLETAGYATDPAFFKIFSFPLIEGNAKQALNGVHNIVLTQKLAKKLFGNTNPMGKIVKIDSTANFTVTGVMQDLPNNTMFNFEYLVPWSYMKEVGWDDQIWKNHSVETYALLKPGVTLAAADKAFKNIYKQHGEQNEEVFVHPMAKWWLYSNSENGQLVAGHIVVVRLFMIIAAFIMIIACINYMNLGTARSTRRAKEVGIRKVSGAGKEWLIKQFLGESVLIALVSGTIGLALVWLSLPWFNSVIGKELVIPYTNPVFWLTGIGFILFTGIISGSYPAFYLSGFKPINTLKGTFKAANTLIAPRKFLVVVQFTFAIAFIICTVVIYRQIKFAQNRDTGYDLNNLAYVYMKGDIARNYPIIKSELMRSGAVTNITRTNSPALDIWTNNDSYEWPGKAPNTRQSFAEYITDGMFAKTLGLPIIQGRDIDVDRYPADTSAMLLNEHAAKTMGLTNAVGQHIKSWKGNLTVVGVVKNFVAGSPYAPPLPVVIRGHNKKEFGTISLRLNNDNSTSQNVSAITSIFKKYNPDYPFDYKFYDDAYSVMFEDDKNTGKIAAVFAGLTIFISCMGLFALAACMAEGRVKEIGIRKVLGASVTRITTLLTKDFLILICISFVIAAPIAWWLMSGWLSHYPYHTNLSWWIFGVTGVCSIIIAFSTVAYQAVKAAIVNPVRSLKTE